MTDSTFARLFLAAFTTSLSADPRAAREVGLSVDQTGIIQDLHALDIDAEGHAGSDTHRTLLTALETLQNHGSEDLFRAWKQRRYARLALGLPQQGEPAEPAQNLDNSLLNDSNDIEQPQIPQREDRTLIAELDSASPQTSDDDFDESLDSTPRRLQIN